MTVTRTPFAGLTQLTLDESIAADNGSFLERNPALTDVLLKLGAQTHKHDAHDALAMDGTAPTVTPFTTGGTIPSGQTLHVTYTWVDAYGGETVRATSTVVATQAPMATPTLAPTAVISTAAGTLLADVYYYAVSVIDGTGGETPLGPAVGVTVPSGFPNNQVQLSDLDDIVNEVGGTGWRLWRRQAGGDFHLLSIGTIATYTDDGGTPVDCGPVPSTSASNTNSTNSIEIDADLPLAAGVAVRVFISSDGTFQSPCFYAQYAAPYSEFPITVTALSLTAGAPPLVSTCKPGANKIDPDTDMLDFPWKRSVANAAALPAVGNEDGDARVTRDDGHIHRWIDPDWIDLDAVAYRHGHTFTYAAEVKVASGADYAIPPFYAAVMPGWTAKIAKVRHSIDFGTSATVKLQKNGVDVTGFTAISVTTTPATIDPADVAIVDDDKVALVVTAVSGNPKILSFTIHVEYTRS